MGFSEECFGYLADGRAVSLYRLRNRQGMEAAIMNWGGTLVSLRVPDGQGHIDDVVLGFDTLDEYLRDSGYFGCLIGRVANRLAHGKFTLAGIDYQLTCNDGAHHLHGGVGGLGKVLWQAEVRDATDGPQLRLSYASPDGEEGYPGTLQLEVIYTLTQDNELRLDYEATCDRSTIVNLTHHGYFNLAGRGSILGHRMHINASWFLPTDDDLIPVGEKILVQDTPMNFRVMKDIGAQINEPYLPLQQGGGYDHNWVLNTVHGELTLAAEVLDPHSGREMRVYTSQPGLQFYSGNYLDGTLRGRGGVAYQKHAGFCLEAQHFPDAPHHPDFPSIVLGKGEIYRQTTVYCFAWSHQTPLLARVEAAEEGESA